MVRPPKRINPAQHRGGAAGDGRAFQKGRFANAPAPPDDETPLPIEDEPTPSPGFTVEDHVPGPLSTVRSKYDGRPSTGAAAKPDEAGEDVVIDLTESGRIERKIVVDLTKLPPIDVSRRSDSIYIRHSAGWPTTQRWRSRPS